MSYLPTSHAAVDAREAFVQGRNCAQSVLHVLSDAGYAPTLSEAAGAGFTLGIGGSGCVCGALAAGVVALSAFVEAEALEPVAQQERAHQLSADFHDRFTERWGAACCRSIKRGMTEGSPQAMAHCASITEWTVQEVSRLLAEEGRAPGWAARDLVNAARRLALDMLAGGAIGLAATAVLPAAQSLLAGIAIGATVGASEFHGVRMRGAGRLFRTLGALAATLAASVALFAPASLSEAVAVIFGQAREWPAILAMAAVLAAAIVTAAVSAYEQWTYR